MQDPTITVAMCTYNGTAHIQEQLESIAAQSLLPTELIVCDDASTDSTVDQIKRFAATSPFPVRLEINEINVGYQRNFANAIRLANGQLILCSDQDDVWLPEKIHRFAECLKVDPRPGLIICDAYLVDERLEPLGRTYWTAQRFGANDQHKVEGEAGSSVIIRDPTWFAAGATMGFASAYKDLVLPFPDGWTHDAWIATVVSSVARVALIPEPLNYYRQHSSQAFGGAPAGIGDRVQTARGRSVGIEHFNATAQRYEVLRSRLENCPIEPRNPNLPSVIADKIDHWNARTRMRRGRRLGRLPTITSEIARGRYRSSSQGWKSVAMDIFF